MELSLDNSSALRHLQFLARHLAAEFFSLIVAISCSSHYFLIHFNNMDYLLGGTMAQWLATLPSPQDRD